MRISPQPARRLLALSAWCAALSLTLVASQQPPAKRPAAGASALPQIVVGGLQIVKVAIANDDFSAKPFNSDNGAKMVLWIKMPAGQGLIEIDEDTSVLQHFGDDKGTDLGGKFGSFPDEFKDGSGGTIDIGSSAIPAAGATHLLAEGTVAMTVASSTTTVRVPNVRIEDGRTFKLGATTITLAEVSTDGEDLRFTMKLPRSVMTGIKQVTVLDAKGQPLEGGRTGSGYMNDDAEMGLRAKTAQKTVTLQFENWQGMRTIKVPFKVSSGLSLVP